MDINNTDGILEKLVLNLANGNLGTFFLVIDLLNRVDKISDIARVEAALLRMEENNIVGEKLYMLWNDCLNRDNNKLIDIMLNNDIDDINYHINFENGRGIKY